MNKIDESMRAIIFHRYQQIEHPSRFNEFIWYHVEVDGPVAALDKIISPIKVLESIIKNPDEVSEDLKSFHKEYVNLLKRGETPYIRKYYDFHKAAEDVFCNGGSEDEIIALYEMNLLYFAIQ